MVSGPTQDNLLEGELLDQRYRLGRSIGRGGMGDVYEAVQVSIGRKVAIKVLHSDLAKDPLLLERFRREARAAAELGHPNIIQVTDFHRGDSGIAFMVMERLEGRTLHQCISRKEPFSAERTAFIGAQISSALEAAHAAGIIHRDLKPPNIFLTDIAGDPDFVKVLDFGIAKLSGNELLTQVTRTGVVMGTPAFMSPEQARGETVDARADIYAVGAMLYCMLAGQMPFAAPNVNALLFALQEQTPTALDTINPGLPGGLVRIIERAMAKNPADRFQSVRELRVALEAFARVSLPAPPAGAAPGPDTISDAETLAGPFCAAPAQLRQGTPGSARGPAAPLRALALAAGVAVLCLGLIAAVMFFSPRQEPLQDPPKVFMDGRAAFRTPPQPPDTRPALPDAATALDLPTRAKAKPPRKRRPPIKVKKKQGTLYVKLSGMNMRRLYTASWVRQKLAPLAAKINTCHISASKKLRDLNYSDWSVRLTRGGEIIALDPKGNKRPPPEVVRCMRALFRKVNLGPTRTGEGGTAGIFFQFYWR